MNTYMHVTDAMQQNVADTMGNLLASKKDENDEKIVRIPGVIQIKSKSAGSRLPNTFANNS